MTAKPDTPNPAPEHGAAGNHPPPRRADVRGVRRPWWSRLLGWMLAPWINLKIETQASTDGSEIGDGRPVVYVLERHGLSNVLILERACHEAGLPSQRLAPDRMSTRLKSRH